MNNIKRIQDMKRVTELVYDRKYSAANDKVMDEVTAWVGQQSPFVGFYGDFSYYSLNEEQTQVVRLFNGIPRTIELSDKVSVEIEGTIKDILKTEIRGPDLAA